MITDYRTLEYPYRGYRIVFKWEAGTPGPTYLPQGWYASVHHRCGACDASFCHAVRAHTIILAEEWVDDTLAEAAENLIEIL